MANPMEMRLSRSRRKLIKCQRFLASDFLGGTTATFLQQLIIVSVIYCPSFSKVWLSSVC